MSLFIALAIILLFLCIIKIKDAVNMSNYLTIIFITMFIIPIFTLGYYSSITPTRQPIGNKISLIWKIFGNLMTIALIICVVFLNLITADGINYLDAIPNSKNVTVNAVLIVIACLVGVGGLGYLIPIFYKSIKEWLKPSSGTNVPPVSATASTAAGFALMFTAIKDSLFSIGRIANDFINNLKKEVPSSEDKQGAFLKYTLLYGFIFMIIVLLYMAAFDPTALTSKAYVYTFTAIIPLVALLGFVVPFSTAQRSPTATTLLIGVIVAILGGAVYSYSSMNAKGFEYMSYFINFILFLIVMVGLAIFFYIFGNYLKSLEGLPGFIIYFIFYIPCLLIDFFNYILNEFRMTSQSVYILFFIEVILILFYIYLPKIMDYILSKTSSDQIVLLANTEYLDTVKVIGNSYQLRMTTPDALGNNASDEKKYAYRKSYSISLWTYLNIQPPNNASYSTETTIFDYGNGKPRITYYNDMTSDKTENKYNFYFTDSSRGPSSLSLTLLSQKWNYIVFNYYSNKVDLFINGNLERTYTFNNNMPNYLAIDNVIIGSDGGLDGAVCNVNYYTSPLSKTKISNIYNLLKLKNPPTFSS
jgi:hypothetical protein